MLDTIWSQKEIAASIPGARWDIPEIPGAWSVPLSWNSCLALRSTFEGKLEIGPRLAAWAWREKTERIDPALAMREALDAPGAPDLYPFQRAGVEFIRLAKRVLLGDDPGSGKTVQAIRGVAALLADGHEVFPMLVVCPNTMKMPWRREFERWWPGVVCSVVKGSAAKRRKALETPAHVYIINWESLRSHSRLSGYGSTALKKCTDHGGEDPRITENACEVHPRELNRMRFKTVVADECHRAKDPKSKQTRALWAASGDAPFRIGLSGTPIANNVIDLWPILHWLDDREWPSKTRWVDRMVDVMLNAFGGMMVLGVKPHRTEEFYAALHPHFRRMPKKLVLPFLPPIIPEQRDVELSPKQLKAYREMKEKLMADLESGLLTTPSKLTQTIRLLQLSCAMLDVHEEERVDKDTGEIETIEVARLTEPSSKLDDLMHDLTDLGSESVAIMAVSRQLIELLSERMTKAKIPHGLVTGAQDEDERQRSIDDFQNGKIQFILFTAAAGGAGITLTAARYLIRLQRPWSRVDDVQALNRVHRIGSEIHESIIVIDYVTEGTLEHHVMDVLDNKNESFEGVVRDNDLLLRVLGMADDDR